ncbi:HAD family hydrolase [Rhizosaccharibacter radicis]|uniref:HAD-IA family hydrolase n=1 Tax=Rhizosaccharibacter radicis TaxID=2782605 RepID=A0ABT1VZR9_9PROT|nr:HAD-IA family hydrolase [Acetobacteraceae bacterium KSS12]
MVPGLLFDLDGTVADTDPLHFDAFNAILGEFGRSMTHEEFRTGVSGVSNAAIMRWLFPDLDVARHVELADRKEALFREMAARMQPLAGLEELLALAERRGMPVGVVTNAPRLNAEHMLRSLGLERFLPGIVVGEEIERGKPDPLPYRIGLERLPRPADRALAFEDSVAGVSAASGAGIFTVGIRTSLDDATLRNAGADLTVSDYLDPAFQALLARIETGEDIVRRGPPAA